MGDGDGHSIFNYNTRKTIVSGLFDVALVIENASQLKTMLNAGPGNKFYYPNIVLISMSVLIQFIVAGFLIKLASMDATKPLQDGTQPKREKAKMRLNNATMVLVVGILFLNAFIASFGVEMTKEK
ncbi:NINJ1-like protein [Mya arenaria]|uniref:NINJ1-like protein n=1 Tax=Mya arenaria TaxID=6604 RepID=A0ABY7DA63_MYAAR|nr:ninjurin-2-like [Mya arenaria]WAQ93501.1 NINJ1-like protein [Mya arenaria]